MLNHLLLWPLLFYYIFIFVESKKNSINKISNNNIKAKYGPERKGDVKHSRACIEKTIKYLDYNSLVNFEEGLALTFNNYKKLHRRNTFGPYKGTKDNPEQSFTKIVNYLLVLQKDRLTLVILLHLQ